jgi:hypothetical protein
LESLLENIGLQTRLPNLVVIRASSCKVEDIPFLEDLAARSWPFPLKILSTAANQYAAQNRNEGSDAVPEFFDAISYFDSDDLMHPRRLELIEEYLKEGADAILHCYTKGGRNRPPLEWAVIRQEPVASWDAFSLCKTIVLVPGTGTFIPFSKPLHDSDIPLHFGHISVRLACFRAIRYRENALRYEDAQFLSDIIMRGYRIVTIDTDLSFWSQLDVEEEIKKFNLVYEDGPALAPAQ